MRAHELFEKAAQAGNQRELTALLHKEALDLSGFGQALKSLALKDVGGPKGFLQPAARAMAHGKAGTGKLLAPVARVPTRTVRAPGGAYDVSRQAREMGIV